MYNDMDYSAFETINNDYMEFWEMNENDFIVDDENDFIVDDEPMFCTDENSMCWYE